MLLFVNKVNNINIFITHSVYKINISSKTCERIKCCILHAIIIHTCSVIKSIIYYHERKSAHIFESEIIFKLVCQYLIVCKLWLVLIEWVSLGMRYILWYEYIRRLRNPCEATMHTCYR